MEKKFLSSVYGYKKIKEELELIYSWYKDKSNNENLLLPKGILFYGPSGYGKTLFTKEYARLFDYPIFVIGGKEDNILDEVISAYEKARKEKNAIVIIDELDILIENDPKLLRVLQTQLDGYENENSVLTLATTNHIWRIPEALLREGRFDRKFEIGAIEDLEDAKEMILGFLNNINLTVSENELESLCFYLQDNPPVMIKSILSNYMLRFGNKLTLKNLARIIDYLDTGYIDKDSKYVVQPSLAIHEAGHAYYAYKYCNTKKFLRVYYDRQGGKTLTTFVNKYATVETMMQSIRTALAGVVAEELLLGKHEIGCESDMEKAYENMTLLINRNCIKGVEHYYEDDVQVRKEKLSNNIRNKSEQLIRKEIKREYKRVKFQLKKDKKLLKIIADFLIKNQEIDLEQLENLVNSSL